MTPYEILYEKRKLNKLPQHNTILNAKGVHSVNGLASSQNGVPSGKKGTKARKPLPSKKLKSHHNYPPPSANVLGDTIQQQFNLCN
jgi:hypothetical protein